MTYIIFFVGLSFLFLMVKVEKNKRGCDKYISHYYNVLSRGLGQQDIRVGLIAPSCSSKVVPVVFSTAGALVVVTF